MIALCICLYLVAGFATLIGLGYATGDEVDADKPRDFVGSFMGAVLFWPVALAIMLGVTATFYLVEAYNAAAKAGRGKV